jgi:glutathione peroxidase
MKIKNLILLIMFLSNLFTNKAIAKDKNLANDVYDFSFTRLIEQDKFKLNDFKNKVILIVNTASKCGFTKQYASLEKLHNKYKDQGLVIIGVPSADFGGQEFSSSQEIQNFCKFNYGVSFLMTQKEIVSGKDAHPFYKFANQALGGLSAPKWNFHKFLINKKGQVIDYFISSTDPLSEKITKAIESELAKSN